MSPGIFYFYHYTPGHPPCNVGFLKLNSRFSTCSIELHIRNIPVSQGDTLKLGAFYPKDGSLLAVPLSDIVAKTNAVFAKYDIPEALFANHCTLPELGGFFLTLPDGNMIAATTPDTTFNPKSLHFLRNFDSTATPKEDAPAVPTMAPVENAPAAPAAASAESTPDVPVVAVAESTSDVPVVAVAESTSDVPIVALTNVTSNVTVSQAAEITRDVPATAPTENAPTIPTATSVKTTPAMTAAVQKEVHAVPTMGTTTETNASPAASATAAMRETYATKQKVRKISRQDLRVLPRKYWNLSNNSFLMHGYYNYNHLLLVEKDGHYLIGVPGIYSTRESHAASLFGFSRFTDEYNDKMQLAGEEQNNFGTFGYWCCEIPIPAANGEKRRT